MARVALTCRMRLYGKCTANVRDAQQATRAREKISSIGEVPNYVGSARSRPRLCRHAWRCGAWGKRAAYSARSDACHRLLTWPWVGLATSYWTGRSHAIVGLAD